MAAIPVPISRRRYDIVFAVISVLFALSAFVPDTTNLLRIDLMQMDKVRASPPAWPPLFILEMLEKYARACDHLLLHNPLYFQAMIWGDVLFTGPFYVAACYAFLRGRDWIRIPAFVYASHVLSYAVILTAENLAGPYASPRPLLLFGAYGPYWVYAIALMIRLRRHEPFRMPLQMSEGTPSEGAAA